MAVADVSLALRPDYTANIEVDAVSPQLVGQMLTAMAAGATGTVVVRTSSNSSDYIGAVLRRQRWSFSTANVAQWSAVKKVIVQGRDRQTPGNVALTADVETLAVLVGGRAGCEM